MAKKTSEDGVSIPGGVILRPQDHINYRSNAGEMRTGVIARFWDAGDYGWMSVLDDKTSQYEVVSIAVQVQHVGAAGIIIEKKAA